MLYPVEEPVQGPVGGTSAEQLTAEQLAAVVSAWYRLQVQNAQLLQHLAAVHDINPIDLRVLKFLGVDSTPRTPKELGRFLEVANGNVTALIDRLEFRQFIGREPNPDDRRSILVHLEARGLEIVTELREIYRRSLLGVVTAENHEDVLAAAGSLSAHLASASTER